MFKFEFDYAKYIDEHNKPAESQDTTIYNPGVIENPVEHYKTQQ